MPKGRGSNERRRNRRTEGRRGRSDSMAYVEGLERGRTKLEALYQRAFDVQARRRKALR